MKLFNSLTNKKEEFVPITPGKVGIYACGPTVYNFFHIGNARPFIVFDTLRRYLEYRGYEVTFVQNFTDIDDKMIRAAAEQGITVAELGERFIAEYFTDAQGLGVRPATVHPRATKHMAEIIAMIEKLIENGHAYPSADGDVYYDTQSFESYGKLSGQNLDDLELGARIEINEKKRHPMDFALWKAQKPGEPAWDSPWGQGRPGWHIECSAMSRKYLGDTFDIHCGGKDLKFPHHENEIAQSEGATGKPFVHYWLHNGYINIDGQKMSKSLNNFFTVRDIAKVYDLQVVRMFMLSAHYRNPINFADELLAQAKTALERIANCRDNLEYVAAQHREGASASIDAEAVRRRFIAAMDDDLNTADALAVIFDLVRELNTEFATEGAAEEATAALTLLDELLGVLGLVPKEADAIPAEVTALAEQRTAARKAKDWATADALRAKITALGYEIKDAADGVKLTKLNQ